MAQHKQETNIFDEIENGQEGQNTAPFGQEANIEAQSKQAKPDFEGGFFVDNSLLQGFEDQDPSPSAESQEGGGFLSKVSEAFTGAERTTKELESLPPISAAPEFNTLSKEALLVKLGFLMTGDTGRLKKVLKKQYPDIKFKDDKKGNPIAILNSVEYSINPPGLDFGDAVRGVADIAAFTPAGRAAGLATSVIGKAAAVGAASGVVEGVKEGIISGVGGGPVNTENIILATGLGSAGQFAGDLIGAGVNIARGSISAEKQALIDSSEAAGVRLPTSDAVDSTVSRGVDKIGSEIPIAGTGGSRIAQEAERNAAVQAVLDDAPDVSSDIIFENLKNNVSRVKKAAGNSLGKISDKMDQFGEVDLSNLNSSIDSAINSLRSVRGQADQMAISKLEELKGALSPRDGVGFKFSDLRDQRTFSRGEFDSIDPLSRSQLTSFGKSQTDKVMKEFTKTLDNFVRQNSTSREVGKYKRANAVYGEEARKLSKGRLKNVLDNGEITPEKVNALITSRNKSEIENLYRGLNFQGKDNVRSAILHDAARKATKNEELDVNSFIKQLDNLNKSTGIFFKGTNQRQLKGLKNLLRATSKAQTSKPGLVGQAKVTGGITAPVAFLAGVIPALATATSIGMAARIYESKPVRDMLLKLANETAGSRRVNEIISKSQPAITAVLQNIRRESELNN